MVYTKKKSEKLPPKFQRKKPGRALSPQASKAYAPEIDLSEEILGIIDGAKVKVAFPKSLERKKNEYGAEPSEDDCRGRKDYTKIPFVTIDGETAKDFDDAVYATTQNGSVVVYVAIADVAHYIASGDSLDEEAQGRSTSVYFPGRCIPMLPEFLSNGLCSLMPKVKRLAMVAEFEVSAQGETKLIELTNGVIQSHARITYTEVQKFLDKKPLGKRKLSESIKQSLGALKEASSFLRASRNKRGAIDFDLVESFVALDDNGEPVAIHPQERLESNRLIEDLMVAANEVVATFLTEKKYPLLYRIHEAPSQEKMEGFLTVVGKSGLVEPRLLREYQKNPTPMSLANIMAKLKVSKAYPTYELLLLRSLMQAKYSLDNMGHFGLASTCYAHFTSPIRRYPDLTVHRMAKLCLKNKNHALSVAKQTKLHKELTSVAEHCSTQERVAMDVERKVSSLFAAYYMKGKVGEEDIGKVTGCTEFGLFIRLKKFHVEGLLHISQLPGYFIFDPERLCLNQRRGKLVFGIGDELTVLVANANVEKRFIDLSLPGKDGGKEGRRHGRTRSKRR